MAWNHNATKNNVFGVVFPVYLIGRCLGFLPFSVNFDTKHKTSRVTLNPFDVVWFVTMLSVYGACMAFNFQYDFHSSQTNSLILIVSGRITLIGGFFMADCALIADMLNRKCIWSIITKFHEFDEEVMMGYLVSGCSLRTKMIINFS